MEEYWQPSTHWQTDSRNIWTRVWNSLAGCFVNHLQHDWVKWFPLAEFASNNGMSETTECTPIYAVQGIDRGITFAGEWTKDQDQQRVSADQVQPTIQQIHHQHIRVEMRRSHGVQEEAANRVQIPALDIQEGFELWLDAWHVWTTRPTQKLDWKLLGPFKVIHRISPYAYKLDLAASVQIHRVQPVSLLDPVANDSFIGQQFDPPPSVEVDGEKQYQVSSVEDSRIYQSQLQYLIWWTGYDSLTWELAKFVDGLQAVGEFHQSYPMKPGPLENVLGGPRT